MKRMIRNTAPVFNSLGSNYSWGLVWRSLGQWVHPDKSAPEKLKQQLMAEFSGEAFLTYKGRDAIELALRALDVPNNSVVLTQAFSCLAIEEAVVRAGWQPMYCDLSQDNIVVSPETLQAAWDLAVKSGQRPRALILQHTLGVAAPVKAIAAWCKEHQVTLIEDLASAVGGVDADGVSLGSYGEMVILSFGRDKVWDAVSGGAVIIKSLQLAKVAKKFKLVAVPKTVLWRDLSYPLLTWMIRTWYSVVVGRVLMLVARAIGWMRSPVASAIPAAAALPAPLAALALYQWQQLTADITHRRQLAKLYQEQLPAQLQLLPPQAAAASSQVRYPMVIDHPQQLTAFLKQRGFYLSDRWYRLAVDGGSVGQSKYYQPGSCPRAEWLAQKCFNLPTHRNTSLTQAQKLCQLITNYTTGATT